MSEKHFGALIEKYRRTAFDRHGSAAPLRGDLKPRCAFIAFATLISLAQSARAQGDVNRAAVEASLDSLMRAYAAAFEARDAERVVALYAPGVATFGWNDGQPTAYTPYVAALRGFIREWENDGRARAGIMGRAPN